MLKLYVDNLQVVALGVNILELHVYRFFHLDARLTSVLPEIFVSEVSNLLTDHGVDVGYERGLIPFLEFTVEFAHVLLLNFVL